MEGRLTKQKPPNLVRLLRPKKPSKGQPNSDGPHPSSDGLQPNSDGLLPNSDGLHIPNFLKSMTVCAIPVAPACPALKPFLQMSSNILHLFMKSFQACGTFDNKRNYGSNMNQKFVHAKCMQLDLNVKPYSSIYIDFRRTEIDEFNIQTQPKNINIF